MRCLSAIAVASILVLSGCTSVVVRPVAKDTAITYVCIQDNPRVQVDDFVPVIRDVLDAHGIASEVFRGDKPEKCEYVLTYTALRTWDFKPYLSHAEVRLEHAGRQVGYGEYHLNGGGGLSLTKWAPTREKMTPVIEQMLGY